MSGAALKRLVDSAHALADSEDGAAIYELHHAIDEIAALAQPDSFVSAKASPMPWLIDEDNAERLCVVDARGDVVYAEDWGGIPDEMNSATRETIITRACANARFMVAASEHAAALPTGPHGRDGTPIAKLVIFMDTHDMGQSLAPNPPFKSHRITVTDWQAVEALPLGEYPLVIAANSEGLVQDMAMLIRRLARCLEPHIELRRQAIDYLKAHGLIGQVLRKDKCEERGGCFGGDCCLK